MLHNTLTPSVVRGPRILAVFFFFLNVQKSNHPLVAFLPCIECSLSAHRHTNVYRSSSRCYRPSETFPDP